MTTPVNTLSNLNSLSGTSSVGTSGNIQLLFAELQLELAKENKTAAYDKIKGIQNKQADSKNVSDVISILRNLKGKGDKASLNDEQKKKLNEMSFSDGKSLYSVLGKNESDLLSEIKTDSKIEDMITTLSSYQESVTSSVQQEMIFVSDFMGQYNSYLQGASSQVSKNSDVLTALARG